MKAELTIDDLQNDPKKYGLPTFEEFCQNPDKWRMAKDRAWELLDVGSVAMKNQIAEHVYYVAGYKCQSLEMAQRVLEDEYGLKEAIDLKSLGVKIELEDLSMGKYRSHIYIDPKKNKLEGFSKDAALKDILTTS